MPTLEEMINTDQLNTIDKTELSHGFYRGNYANAYETEDYEQAVKQLVGQTGFYRVGFLVGFFSSYELHEVPGEQQDEVERYRKAFQTLNIF